MIFTTPQFVLFFFIFYAIYMSLKGTSRKVFLLAASYFFYGSWNAKFLLLIFGSTLLDFYVGRAIHATDDPKKRKHLLVLSIFGNLGALGFFKYFNFFVSSAVDGLLTLGISVQPTVLQVVLPVGISFYTFQTMSYAIDVYRRKIVPTSSLLDFCLYVAFFPQLVAGPIERSHNLLPQLSRLNSRPMLSGWFLIALGSFKKVVIADRMASLVAATYASPENTYPLALWLGTYAFAIQIYCDFSGYSDIAVGLSRLMGIELVQNFNAPYAAKNPSDFWKRWHISLSTWLRDYLYIPLGGNHGTWLSTQRNLILTMLLGGLWHGARWNFVFWGAYHGLLLVLFRLKWVQNIGKLLDNTGPLQAPILFIRRLIFFHLVCLGWALFRAQTFADCRALISRLLNFTKWNASAWIEQVKVSGEGTYLAFVFAVIVLLIIVQNIRPEGTHKIANQFWKLPSAIRFVLLASILVATVVLAPEEPPPFIYFQF